MDSGLTDTGTISLLTGTVIQFRPILPTDQVALQRFHARLSDRSIYLRFFFMQPQLGDVEAGYFTHVDGIDRFALVALDPDEPGEIAAVVRFDRSPGTDRAEYAAVVADRWQGHGLGTALTRHLIASASNRGVRHFFAFVLPENVGMLRLLRDLGLPERVENNGSVELVEIGPFAESTSTNSDEAPQSSPGEIAEPIDV